MLTRIIVERFKSFRKADLQLGAMNLLVGANGGGKSNFLDALRVLQGIGNGFTVGEILDGKPKSATNEAWDGIRGGSVKACFEGDEEEETFELQAQGRQRADDAMWRYFICIAPSSGHVVAEALRLGDTNVFKALPPPDSRVDPTLRVEYPGSTKPLNLERSRSALVQLPQHPEVPNVHGTLLDTVASQLANVQRIDPAPSVLRGYASALFPDRMGEQGENFAGVVAMLGDQSRAYLDWLRELYPQEVDDVEVVHGALGEPMFAICERGRTLPAPVLSDGTLRFAAIAASFFQSDMPEVMTIEEIEKGLHPSRVRLMVEMLRAHSSDKGTQIMATTHSPAVIAWLEEKEYDTTFVFARDAETGESTVTRLADIEGFEDIVSNQELADLFAEGWMESAL